MAEGLIRTLARLLEEGSIPWSRVTSKQRDRLRSLMETNVLTVERSGSGKRLEVQSERVVRQFAENQYPEGLDRARTAADGSLHASEAVARLRDAKRGVAGEEIVLFRGEPSTTIIHDGTPVQIGDLTEAVGVSAVLLGPKTTIEIGETLAVVENREAFLQFEGLGTKARLACFGNGRLSSQMLEWLGFLASEEEEIIHCPDYDPVGLSDFQRLYDACGKQAHLFWPDGLESLIEKYGKTDLYEKNYGLLEGLGNSSHPAVQRLLPLLHRYGRGLEQEILLSERVLSNDSSAS